MVGNFENYEVFVKTNDAGNNPHFHVWDATSRGTDKKRISYMCKN